MKIGVLLPSRFSDSGDYLADARALDAAGVDSLWLPDDGFDPWLVLAGIAAVTGRARLMAPVSPRETGAPDELSRRIATLDRLSRGRLVLTATPPVDARATQALISCARRAGQYPVLLPSTGDGAGGTAAIQADGLIGAGDSPEQCRELFEEIARRREQDGLKPPFELWARIGQPDGREDWRRLVAAGEAAGATGLLVASNPRLLDLLRNTDEEDDRSDLTLAQG